MSVDSALDRILPEDPGNALVIYNPPRTPRLDPLTGLSEISLWTNIVDEAISDAADNLGFLYDRVMDADINRVVADIRDNPLGSVVADVLTPFIPTFEQGREVVRDVVTVVSDHIESYNEEVSRRSMMESKRAYDRARQAARQRAEEEQLPFEEVVINEEGDTIRIPGRIARQETPLVGTDPAPSGATGNPMPFRPF
nr:MAG: hypothetical protein [Arizlama virus]